MLELSNISNMICSGVILMNSRLQFCIIFKICVTFRKKNCKYFKIKSSASASFKLRKPSRQGWAAPEFWPQSDFLLGQKMPKFQNQIYYFFDIAIELFSVVKFSNFLLGQKFVTVKFKFLLKNAKFGPSKTDFSAAAHLYLPGSEILNNK